ncbi:energy transducer TonB [Shewanella sp. A25]|nr:energy transducer TonB [Shewanella shenzhenensis]
MLNGKPLPLASLAVLALSTSFTLSASEITFSQAYSDYKAAVTQEDKAKIETSAQLAFQLGETQFAKESVDLANLAMNWASAIEQQITTYRFSDDNKPKVAQAHDLYQLALTNYKKHYGEQSLELIDPLLGLAETEAKAQYAKEHYQKAIEIAEKSANKKLLADIKMAAFQRLSHTELYTRSVKDYAFDAYEIYKEVLPENAIDRVKATYIVGAVEFAEKHDKKAEPLLLEVVKQFGALNYSHPYALSAHAYLVELYERSGKREESTAHCLAIGKMRPWADTQQQQPIFRTAPDYPMSYAKQGRNGYVTLNLTIDEMGFVRNPEVIESKGGPLFERETLKMIDQWRYAPKFENGKPIAAQTTVRIDYTIGKS